MILVLRNLRGLVELTIPRELGICKLTTDYYHHCFVHTTDAGYGGVSDATLPKDWLLGGQINENYFSEDPEMNPQANCRNEDGSNQ